MALPVSLLISIAGLIACGSGAYAQSLLIDHDFQVIELNPEARTEATRYFDTRVRGTEYKNNSLNRLSMISANQLDYPVPESACGPIAMLNILVWYETFGLIEPFSRQSDPELYKLTLFKDIDRRITERSGTRRTELKGTKALDIAIIMDEIVQQRSDGKIRIDSSYTVAPLKLKHLLDTMPNFRAGYLIVEPKDRHTGKLRNTHAATLIRADRAGYITLSTWGQVYRGLLRKRADGQWFIPQDPEHLELKVSGMIRFIPFAPATPAGR